MVFRAILISLFMLMTCAEAATAAGLPANFDLEVEKALRIEHHWRDPIIYQFRGQTVSGSWRSETKVKDLKVVSEATVKGTFIDGVLHARQQVIYNTYLLNRETMSLPQNYPKGPVNRGILDAVISGQVVNGNQIKIHFEQRLTRSQSIAADHRYDSKGNIVDTVFAFKDAPITEKKPTVMDFVLDLPVDSGIWYQNAYFTARGEKDTKLEWALDRLSGQMDSLSGSLMNGKLDLASSQWASIKASLMDLKADLARKSETQVSLVGSPARKAIEHFEKYEKLSQGYVKLHKTALSQNDWFNQHILDLKLNFMNNVMKVMATSFISWTNVIPTDLYAGIEGYSMQTSLFALPRTLASWQEQASKDASILKDQKRTIMMMGDYARYWSKVAEACVRENRKIHDHYDRMRKGDVLAFASRIQQDISGLRLGQ
ncbi:hypothetical protein [uncultured Cohaesibacter sp.]|uniref:hypothetical protein n=1 Tax=uncultured Cohaesibacter sp. TaxID=1002546 RepID=UPI0029C77B25|nr:hypothetical protein [uncultured Cohaesibacter sp.]